MNVRGIFSLIKNWGIFLIVLFQLLLVHLPEQLEAALFPWGLDQPRFPGQEALFFTKAVGLWAPPV